MMVKRVPMICSGALLALACAGSDAPARAPAAGSLAANGGCVRGSVQDCVCASGTRGLAMCIVSGYGTCSCVENAASAIAPSEPTPTGTGAGTGTGANDGAAGAAGGVPVMAGSAASQTGPPIDLVPPEAHAPTGVIFDWPETDPNNHSPACKAGHYVGEYACRLYIGVMAGSGAFDVAGMIDLRLEQTPDGELLRIADGELIGAALAAIPMHADIVGELNCSDSRFDGRLENGTFSVALGLPVPFTEGTFSGPLTADYDHDAAQLVNGEWNMQGELDLVPGSCMNGTWSAHWVSD